MGETKKTIIAIVSIVFGAWQSAAQEFHPSVDMRVPFVPGLVAINA